MAIVAALSAAKAFGENISDVYSKEREAERLGGNKGNWLMRLSGYANPVTGGMYQSYLDEQIALGQEREFEAGRAALNAELQGAAKEQATAASRTIASQLANQIRNANIQYAQTGGLRSGAVTEQYGRWGAEAERQAASAAAQYSLQAKQILEQSMANKQQLQLQRDKIDIAIEQAENQKWQQIGEAIAPYVATKLSETGEFKLSDIFGGGSENPFKFEDVEMSNIMNQIETGEENPFYGINMEELLRNINIQSGSEMIF